MITPYVRRYSAPLAVAALVCAAPLSHAQVVVASFGGDYVTANQNTQASLVDQAGVPGASDSIRRIGNFTTLANPVIGANYSGPAFFGGAQAVKIGVNSANGLASAEITNDVGGDYINLFAQTPSGVTAGSSLNYVLLFDAGGVQYGDLTGFSGRTAGGVSGSLVSRFMIQVGGDYYVSNTTISGGNGQSTWSIATLSTEQWALFTPNTAGDWRGDFGSLTFNQTISSSAVVDSVGWFASRPVDTGTNSALTVREFNVTAIPEPSSYAVLAGLSVLGLAAARRRGRSD